MTVCDADTGETMDGERITLRLEAEDLELLDSFVKKRPEFSNRSHLARLAIRQFIEGASDSPVSEEMGNRVLVEVPRAVLYIMEALVRDGVYNSINGAIEHAVRKEYLNAEVVEDMKRRLLEIRRETPEILP